MNLLPEQKEYKRKMSNKIDALIYGETGSGKTTFAGSFPKALLISTDGNYKNLKIPAIDVEINMFEKIAGKDIPIHGWAYILKIILELKNNTTYETIIIDLLEDVHEICRDYYLKKMGIVHESDNNYGKAWSIVKSQFRSFIAMVKLLPKNIVFISRSIEKIDFHTKEPDVIPNISTKVFESISAYFDLVGYQYRYNTEEGKIGFALKLNGKHPYAFNRWIASDKPMQILSSYNHLYQLIKEK